jgi:hypothetical protein
MLRSTSKTASIRRTTSMASGTWASSAMGKNLPCALCRARHRLIIWSGFYVEKWAGATVSPGTTAAGTLDNFRLGAACPPTRGRAPVQIPLRTCRASMRTSGTGSGAMPDCLVAPCIRATVRLLVIAVTPGCLRPDNQDDDAHFYPATRRALCACDRGHLWTTPYHRACCSLNTNYCGSPLIPRGDSWSR